MSSTALDDRFDSDLWSKLIDADILSAAAPESLGGGGFGVLEQTAVLEALGRQLAAVPYLESVVLAAGALAKFGSEELQQQWAVPAVNGQKILTVALAGDMGEGPVQAQADGDGYRLTGTRTQVPYGPVADAFLVPAETDSGTKVFVVAADDPGVTVTSLSTTGHGSVGHLELHGVELGDRARRRSRRDPPCSAGSTPGRRWACRAFQLGVVDRALELTARVRARTRAVRPADRQLPGGVVATGRRLHRHQGPAVDADPGRVAAVRGPARRHRRPHRGVLGGRGRPPRGPHHGARPRRRRHRHRPPGAPVLPGRQADRVRGRRCHRAAAA